LGPYEWYDAATGHYETVEGLCAYCGETAVRPYLCYRHAEEHAAEAVEVEWWDRIHPPNDDPRHWEDMERWYAELTREEAA